MKEYPCIDREVRNEVIYAFDKLDGQNVRAEWNKKQKFHKFGSRHQLISKAQGRKEDGPYRWSEAIDKIHSKYEKDLHDIFVKNRFEKVIVFFEFGGPNSFAGRHAEEELDVTLIDISVHKKGLLLPRNYLDLVGHLDIAKMLYHGKANELFVEEVKEGKLDGMTFEGVVCKGYEYIQPGLPLMFKVKNKTWILKLAEFCHGDSKLFEHLK